MGLGHIAYARARVGSRFMEYSAFEKFFSAISEKNLIHHKFLLNAVKEMPGELKAEGDAYIRYCLEQGETMDSLADAYLGLVEITNGEQMYFAREGHYRYSTVAEVVDKVYQNPEYMKLYMRGLALTAFLWPQHQRIWSFFNEHLPRGCSGRDYLEIGPGHGMFFLQALKYGGFDSCVGVDLSSTSIAVTRSLIQSGHFGSFENYELVCADFLAHQFERKYHYVVMGEVLEHVEHPELFIEKIAASVSGDGSVFLTTCINAAALDHIFNFETVEGLEKFFLDGGLAIRSRLLVPYTGKTIEQCIRKRYPINVAYVLSPQ